MLYQISCDNNTCYSYQAPSAMAVGYDYTSLAVSHKGHSKNQCTKDILCNNIVQWTFEGSPLMHENYPLPQVVGNFYGSATNHLEVGIWVGRSVGRSVSTQISKQAIFV